MRRRKPEPDPPPTLTPTRQLSLSLRILTFGLRSGFRLRVLRGFLAFWRHQIRKTGKDTGLSLGMRLRALECVYGSPHISGIIPTGFPSLQLPPTKSNSQSTSFLCSSRSFIMPRSMYLITSNRSSLVNDWSARSAPLNMIRDRSFLCISASFAINLFAELSE